MLSPLHPQCVGGKLPLSFLRPAFRVPFYLPFPISRLTGGEKEISKRESILGGTMGL
jgi:hypothetical protein